MFLAIVAIILVIVFLSTRYGMKSNSKPIRVLSYAGIFLSIAALCFLAFSTIVERIEN